MTSSPQAERILWDIQREHLDEGAYLFTQWELALRSPLYTLTRLQETVEARLLAHVDGLVVGGDAVFETLLKPKLKQGQDGEAFVAALVGLMHLNTGTSSHQAVQQALLEGLVEAPAEMRRQLVRACQLMLPASLEEHIRSLLLHVRPGVRVAAMEILTEHGRLSASDVRMALASPEVAVQRAGLVALRRLGLQELGLEVLGPFLAPGDMGATTASPDSLLRFRLALEAALVLGHPNAIPLVYRHVQELNAHSPVWAEGLLLVGARLDRHALPLLRKVLELPSMQEAALLGLGLTGMVEAADLCLEAMGNPNLRGVAGEAFSLISGADLQKDELREKAVPDPDDTGLQEHFLTRPQQDLPRGNPEALTRAWRDIRSRFDARPRYLSGRVETASGMVEALSEGSLFRRRILARRVEVVTQGRSQLRLETLSGTQLSELQTMGRQWST